MMISFCQKSAVIAELTRHDRLSLRKIALRTGVSRGTVAAIANGRQRLRFAASEKKWPLTTEPETTVAPRHCVGCGGNINVIPCRLCACRRRIAERKAEGGGRRADRRAGEPVPQDFFSPEFRDDENSTAAEKQEKYEAIRTIKEADGEGERVRDEEAGPEAKAAA